MKKEIVISRKKSKSIKYFILMIFGSLLLALPIILYFFDFSKITLDIPLIIVILSIICEPIIIFSSIFYFKQIFNDKPVLIVNEYGIHDQISRNSLGMIKWHDIENINIIPYMSNVYYINIILKEPEKYITDQRKLNKYKKRKATKTWGHINFTSLYFKKEFKEVIDLMKYYFNKSKEDSF